MIIVDNKLEDKLISRLDIIKTNKDLYIIGDDAMICLRNGAVFRYSEGNTLTECVNVCLKLFDEQIISVYKNPKLILEGEN